MARSFGESLENVLTRGLDAAQAVALARLQVNAPVPNTSAPNGVAVPVGEGVGFGSALGAIPAWVWAFGAGMLALSLWKR
jgi:hypothetical protein